MRSPLLRALLPAALCLALTGCFLVNEDRSTTDLAKLQKLFQFDLDIAAAHWEVLPTPEAAWLAPGPTDYYHLMAELTLRGPVPNAARIEAPSEWIAPGAAREWLDPAFRSMLAPYENKRVLPTSLGACGAFTATHRRTGMRIEGFMCRHGAKALVYLPLTEAFALANQQQAGEAGKQSE